MAVCKSCGHAFDWRPESVEDVAVCPACFSTVRHPDAPAPKPGHVVVEVDTARMVRGMVRGIRKALDAEGAERAKAAADKVAKGAFSAGCAVILAGLLAALVGVVVCALWSALGL